MITARQSYLNVTTVLSQTRKNVNLSFNVVHAVPGNHPAEVCQTTGGIPWTGNALGCPRSRSR